jgi:hypothetical protein
MKAQKLIASTAAVLFTFASLSAVTYKVPTRQAAVSQTSAIKVTNLTTIHVRPSASELRAAALLGGAKTAGIASVPSATHMDGSSIGQFSLLGSQLAMPYYSFGNKFGSISKE